ncbi:MAG: glutamate--tRNA ligase, partial [Proteobacteria bacterium]|nr:glutamate--tRNA ligase [Pseudomonadota bacterium]
MSQIRVRFAPSPTGFLHVGGLRTALFNFLFAANTGGKTILRIEDTDQNRKVEGAVENLIESLNWAGIKFDEGPHAEGEFGPYVQSQRLDIYKKHADQLVEQKHAYPCFCTEEDLTEMREKQIAAKQDPRYDGRCLKLTDAEVREKLDANAPHVIRLKIDRSRSSILIDDLIRGDVSFGTDQIDDQVLMKSDGYPTYHLANVVDDHLMNITHVIRGEEWLPSTPKHVQLYEYFGWEPPKFAHLPLLLNTDRSKLSKRQGDVATEDYRNKGFLSEALINFVALLGWNTSDDQEIFTLDELKEKFSLDRVGKAGAVFDVEKLRWMNQQYIKQIPNEELLATLKPFLPEVAANSDQDKLEKILQIIRDYLVVLPDAEEKLDLFYNENPELTDENLLAIVKEEAPQKVFAAFIQQVEQQDSLSSENFGQVMKAV